MDNNSTNLEEYFIKSKEVFSRSSLSIDEINSFIKIENQTRNHAKPEYNDHYVEIFTILRDRIIIPNAGKLDLINTFENLSVIIRNSSIRLKPHPQADSICTSLLNSIGQNELIWQYNILRMVLIINTFNHNDWRDQFITRLFDLPSAACFKSMNDVYQLGNVFRSLFNTCEDLMYCLEKHVFTDVFFGKDLTTQRSNFMWVLEVIWNIVFKESPGHMVIIPAWFKLFSKAIEIDDKELVFYMHMPLSHIYLNMCHTQEEFKVFNDKVEIPLSKYIQKKMRKWGFKPNKKKLPDNNGKKIAFVYDRLVGNSPVKLLISLLTYLKEEGDLELFVYDMGYVEKAKSDPAMIEEVKNLGITYINNHDLIADAQNGHHYSHFDKAVKLREQTIKDDIDILIMTGNRMPSGFMFATRTAPMQIFWDHGNHEYDVKNIDKRICHFDDTYRNSFEFERFELKMLPKYLKQEEETNKKKAADIKKKLPEHNVVLGSIGRLMKLSDEYIETVAEILETNPDTIYLACGSGNTEELAKKVVELGLKDRFIITGWIDPQVYGYVIDIYLNTFPLEGGESVNEFIAKGEDKYVVSMQK